MKQGLHPRNRHQGSYDFPALVQASPALGPFVFTNEYGNRTIDFAHPGAVKALNQALLKLSYGIAHWDLPPNYLCPPIPGRADYLHHLADLLAASNGGVLRRGPSVRALDIGCGANLIYPLVGHREYGWTFVGSDIDRLALATGQQILQANGMAKAIELRLQSRPAALFEGVIRPGERFEISLCNPPFHPSQAAAMAGSREKWRKLGKSLATAQGPILNFGGQHNELWCPGGEARFIRTMVEESARFRDACYWFSTLVSKSAHLPEIIRTLQRMGVFATRTINMAQGQKQSRFVAWTFLDLDQQQTWRASRWGTGHK